MTPWVKEKYDIKNNSKINISKVKDINFKKYKPIRAGVLVYSKINNAIYFCFGEDVKYKELTDFGGGVKYIKLKENAFFGAWREYVEESLGVFKDISIDKLWNSIAVYSETMMIILCKTESPQILTKKEFKSKVDIQKSPEVSKIVWLRPNKIFNANVYLKVKTHLMDMDKILSYL